MKKKNNKAQVQKRKVKFDYKKLMEYFKGLKIWLFLGLLFSAGSAVLIVIGPDRISEIVGYIQLGFLGNIDIGAITKIGLSLIIIYSASATFSFLEDFLMATVTLRFAQRLRKDLSKKINKVPQKFFNKVPQGEVLSRITNDVTTLQQSLSNSLPTIIAAIAQFVACLVLMFITEWRLALCTIGTTFIGLIIMILVVKKSQKYFIKKQINIGKLNAYTEEIYSGHDVVRISRAEKQTNKVFGELNRDVYMPDWKSQFYSGLMHPLMNVIANLGYVVVCVAGSALALQGIIDFGSIVAFMIYVRLFSNPLTQIAQSMTQLQSAAAASNRVFEFLRAEEMPEESGNFEEIKDVRGDVIFKNVCFSYPDVPDKIIIKDFSAEVKAGQKVAIVGPTGAGKTTLVNLLMKFYDINSGDILIDRHSISKLTRENIHNIFSMVLQDTWMFEGTVRDNLVYNMKNISDERIIEVCKACDLENLIKELPDGLDTVLSENTTISTGQKQLFTIARAMLKNSPMLILDEATSSVDTRTELQIQRAMDNLMEGRTSFVIAHRLSTIKNADVIFVIRDGDIIERGTHEELLQKNGFYAELYNSQFQDIE